MDAGDICDRVALLGVLRTFLRAFLGGLLRLKSGREQADMRAMDPFRTGGVHALAKVGGNAVETEVAGERGNARLELMR